MSFSMLAKKCFFLLVLVGLRSAWAGSSAYGYFKNPPAAGPTYDFTQDDLVTEGDVINVAWTTNITSLNLQLAQQLPATLSNGGNGFAINTLESNIIGQSTYNWQVDVSGFQPIYPVAPGAANNVFFFWAVNSADNSQWFTCHYFNITRRNIAMSSASSAATNTPSSTAPSSTSPSSTTPSSTAVASSNGLSGGAKISVGVGVGIGVFGLLAGTIIGLCLWRRSRASTQQAGGNGQKRVLDYGWLGKGHIAHHQPSPFELDAHKAPQEMLGVQADPYELHSAPLR